MHKLLSIVIPRFKERENDIFPLLSSISNQVSVDFNDIEVIIANDGDGGDPLDTDFLHLFGNLDIRQCFLKSNKGPGVARQRGLTMACGEYVMFCDADDILHSVDTLMHLIQEVTNNDADELSSDWIEQTVDPDGNVLMISHGLDDTWMHGKVFRKNFIKSNKLKFHDKLRVHEDSYFLAILSALGPKRFHYPSPTYVWKYSPESITRRNEGSYTYDSFSTFIEAIAMAYEQIEKFAPDQLEYRVTQFTLYCYFTFHKSDWQQEKVKEYLKNSETTFVERIKPFWKYWEQASDQTKAQLYHEERNKNFVGQIENETLTDWLTRLGLAETKEK